MSIDKASLEQTKIASISVLSKELGKLSFERAQPIIANSLRTVFTRRIDQRFIDPESSAISGTRPASILNGLTPLAQPAATEAGVTALILAMTQAHDDADNDLRACEIILHPRTAVFLSTLKTSGGSWAYPLLAKSGGQMLGFNVRVSPGAVTAGSPTERIIAMVDPGQILLADDGATELTTSTAVAVQLDSAPTNNAATGTGSSLTSLFQTDSIALKLTRWINWQFTKSTAASFARVTF